MKRYLCIAVISEALLFCVTSGCWKADDDTSRHGAAASLDADPDLAAHTAEFKREVIEVTEGVHVAVGFGLANSILLEGEDGVVIVDTMVGFRFPDTGETYMVHVRRGVAEIQPEFPEKPDIAVTVDSTVWKEIVTGLRNPAVALLTDVEIEGGTLDLVRFLGLFKSD